MRSTKKTYLWVLIMNIFHPELFGLPINCSQTNMVIYCYLPSLCVSIVLNFLLLFDFLGYHEKLISHRLTETLDIKSRKHVDLD